MKHNENGDVSGVFLVVLVIVLSAVSVGLAIWTATSAMTESSSTITITEKVGAHGSEGAYLIFTDDEVFTVEDNIFKWSFDATDRYNDIKEGKTYNVKTTGMRNNFFSFYRNIIEIEEVQP